MTAETSQPSAQPFDLVAPYYDQLMDGVPYEYWLKYLHKVWDRHNHEPQNVLDLACGTGTVSLLMAREGFLVTGVDLSVRMLEEARRKSAAAGIYVNYLNQNATELEIPTTRFDTVISLFDSLNNITEPNLLAECFVRVRSHLTSPGLFVFDLNTAYAFRQGMFNQKSHIMDGPLQYRWRSTYDEASHICRIDMTFEFRATKKEPYDFVEVHRQRAYTVDEMTAALSNAGFAAVAVYDAYSFHPPKKRSDRLFFVAQTV